MGAPVGHTTIGCKWVFRIKYKSNGEVEKFKAQLVAKGFAQKHGIDYDKTFSPVVRFASIRTLLAFAIENDMIIHQMDAVKAFLNGDLEEEIYMQQPEGYVQVDGEHLVCKLRKSLYGLKQSPRCWNKVLSDYLKLIGFEQSTADPCVHTKRAPNSMVVIAVYVDDLIVVADTMEEMTKVKECLSRKYGTSSNGALMGYSDADWAGDCDDQHSTTVNLLLFAKGPISWISKKQPFIALSTSETEYIAVNVAAQEVVWLRRLLVDLNAPSKEPTIIMEDNQGAMALAKNPVAHARTKHIDIKYHYIWEAIQDGLIALHYHLTNEMIVDLLQRDY